jgi:transcription elongation factor GreA
VSIGRLGAEHYPISEVMGGESRFEGGFAMIPGVTPSIPDGEAITADGLEGLRAELEELEGPGRRAMAERINAARQLGDLKENADYHAARDDQGRMEARIRQLQSLVDNAVIVDGGAGASDVVAAGSIVALRYEGDDEADRYLVGSIEERRADVAVVSPASPLGRALLGHRQGDVVEYQAPGGNLKVEIVELEN